MPMAHLVAEGVGERPEAAPRGAAKPADGKGLELHVCLLVHNPRGLLWGVLPWKLPGVKDRCGACGAQMEEHGRDDGSALLAVAERPADSRASTSPVSARARRAVTACRSNCRSCLLPAWP